MHEREIEKVEFKQFFKKLSKNRYLYTIKEEAYNK